MLGFACRLAVAPAYDRSLRAALHLVRFDFAQTWTTHFVLMIFTLFDPALR